MSELLKLDLFSNNNKEDFNQDNFNKENINQEYQTNTTYIPEEMCIRDSSDTLCYLQKR